MWKKLLILAAITSLSITVGCSRGHRRGKAPETGNAVTEPRVITPVVPIVDDTNGVSHLMKSPWFSLLPANINALSIVTLTKLGKLHKLLKRYPELKHLASQIIPREALANPLGVAFLKHGEKSSGSVILTEWKKFPGIQPTRKKFLEQVIHRLNGTVETFAVKLGKTLAMGGLAGLRQIISCYKKPSKSLVNGNAVHTFRGLLDHLPVKAELKYISGLSGAKLVSWIRRGGYQGIPAELLLSVEGFGISLEFENTHLVIRAAILMEPQSASELAAVLTRHSHKLKPSREKDSGDRLSVFMNAILKNLRIRRKGGYITAATVIPIELLRLK